MFRLKPPLITALLLGLLACESPAVPDEGFVAIVTRADGPPDITSGGVWDLRVVEVSSTLGIDIQERILPNDTVIFSLPPASYDVAIDGVPLACQTRGPNAQRAVVYEGGATSTVRFVVTCASLLTIRTAADGSQMDTELLYRVTTPAGEQRTGRIMANDTIRLDDIEPGAHRVELLHAAPRCVVTNDGGRSQAIEIQEGRPQVVAFRLRCTDPDLAPEITSFGSSHRDSVSAFYFEAVDPNPNGPLPPHPDFDRYFWNLTDCHAHSILGPPSRFDKTGFQVEGLSLAGSRLAAADTVRVATVFRTGLGNAQVQGACTSLRVEDWRGNSSGFAVDPIGNEVGRRPVVHGFDVRQDEGPSATYLVFDLEASDPDGDLGGSFVFFLFRDGTVGIADGEPELLALRLEGFERTEIPPLLLRTPSFNRNFTAEDVLEIAVYVIDKEGNFTVARDTDAVN